MMDATAATIQSRIALEAGVRDDSRVTALVRAHFAFVWRTLRRFGVAESEADDAAQRVFLIASEKLEAIERGKERAFLFGTAVRIADKSRRARARRPASSEIEPDGLCDSTPGAEELIEQRRAREMLDSILDELDAKLRTVFVLYELEQLTMAEIADMLDLRPGTVASRLRRAREAFFSRLDRATRSERSGHD